MRSTLFLVLAVAAGGCGIARFEVTRDIAEQTVAGSPLGGLLGSVGVPTPIDVDLSAETAARHTGAVQHVWLDALSFSITGTDTPPGDSDDFSFVDSIDVYVESTRAGSALPRQRVATVQSVAPGTTTLVFDTDTTVDLRPYVEEGARLSADARGHAPPDDVSFDGQFSLGVEVL